MTAATEPRTRSAARARGAGWPKRLLPRSLFGRALLIMLVPVLTLQLVSAFIFYDRHWQDVSRRLTLGLAGDISLMINALHTYPEGPERAWLFRRARYDFAMAATYERGATLPDAPPHAPFGPLDHTLLRVLPERISQPFDFDSRSDPDRVRIRVQLPDGVLQIVVPRKRLFTSTTYIFILWMVGTSLVLVPIAIFFLRRQIRPIRRLAHAAESFGKGVQVVAFKPEGALEVRQAARAFLRMRERIQRQISQRTEMLAGVSHDLRTPLTRMKLQLAMLPQAADGDDTTANLKADVAEMERMVEGYLAFARGEGSEVPVPADLGAILAAVVDGARRKGVDVALTGEDGLILTLRRNALMRALTNLIDNAARHGAKVWVTAWREEGRDGGRDGERVCVAVDDDGPGIPPDQRETVFKPFFRLDTSRNVQTGGVGLGLTIARDVARNHGGDLVLDTAPTGGLRALITLPL